jgi:hypothetical protein
MANEFFNINSFRSQLNSGARPNLFQVSLTAPSGVEDPENLLGSSSKFSFMCRSAAIPAYSVGVIEVPFRGRRIKVPGDRTFAEWTVTIINDDKQGLRKVFDNWMKYINNPNGEEAIREAGVQTTNEVDYRTTVGIEHYRSDGSISRKYILHDAFPTDVSAIDLSYDTTDAIQEFTVTFQYHYLDVGDTSEAGADAGAPSSASAG